MSDRIGHLNLAQAHAALASYHANHEQVEANLAAEEVEDHEAEGAFLSSADMCNCGDFLGTWG